MENLEQELLYELDLPWDLLSEWEKYLAENHLKGNLDANFSRSKLKTLYASSPLALDYQRAVHYRCQDKSCPLLVLYSSTVLKSCQPQAPKTPISSFPGPFYNAYIIIFIFPPKSFCSSILHQFLVLVFGFALICPSAKQALCPSLQLGWRHLPPVPALIIS